MSAKYLYIMMCTQYILFQFRRTKDLRISLFHGCKINLFFSALFCQIPACLQINTVLQTMMGIDCRPHHSGYKMPSRHILQQPSACRCMINTPAFYIFIRALYFLHILLKIFAQFACIMQKRGDADQMIQNVQRTVFLRQITYIFQMFLYTLGSACFWFHMCQKFHNSPIFICQLFPE